MFNPDHFIADCRAALAEDAPEVAIRQLVERAVAEPSEIEAALGSPRQGEFVALHHSPELTVLKVIWTPRLSFPPHDHRMWAVIGLYGGREDNAFYRRAPQGLVTAGGKQLETRDTVLLGPAIIHSVANPLPAFTAALHIYGGDFFGASRSEWTPDTFEERPYDVERARRVFAQANERWQAEGAAAGRTMS